MFIKRSSVWWRGEWPGAPILVMLTEVLSTHFPNGRSSILILLRWRSPVCRTWQEALIVFKDMVRIWILVQIKLERVRCVFVILFCRASGLVYQLGLGPEVTVLRGRGSPRPREV